jgi:hypothetical protein|tara:strand:+ start:676 stop:1602 length:927 start_codon:yes stop_codon:yes gene_type:complete
MAYDYLGITNLVIARFNEVALTSSGFTSARGFQTQCKNAVNDSINYINQREFGWGFNHDTQTTTLVPGTIRYSIPTNAKHVDYETFRVSKDSDLGTAGGALTVMDYKEYLDLHVTQEDDVTATLLDGSLNSSATTITVDSTTGFSSTGTLYIESEQITYTGTSSTTFTGCTRGANSTTAASHSDDVRVAQFDSGATPRHVVRTADNNFLLFPYPDKAYELKFEFFKIPTTLSAATDVPAIPEQFQQVIVDGATAYGYQYRGEAQQYQLNFARFEEGIKHMQSILLNRTEYLRSTFIQRASSSASAAFF